jgi:alpha-beta hydrolase superfamily lysophospholipase
MDKSVYYLPGANGRLETGLGEGLASRGFRVWGRATVGEFKKLSFQEQVDIIAGDLQGPLWHPEARVVANSYGGYLFLHAQLQMPAYIGRVLLLSPILGAFENEARGQYFVPPRADRIMDALRAGTFNAPRSVEVHVGTEDWQCSPDKVTAFCDGVGTTARVVEGLGHMLGQKYVGGVLDTWL